MIMVTTAAATPWHSRSEWVLRHILTMSRHKLSQYSD
jgi:hypothetical protein